MNNASVWTSESAQMYRSCGTCCPEVVVPLATRPAGSLDPRQFW